MAKKQTAVKSAVETELDLGEGSPEVAASETSEVPGTVETVETSNPVELEPFGEQYFAELKKRGVDLRAKGAWQKMYGHFINTIFGIRGKKVADLGCAFGSITSAFADYGANAVGVDISEMACEAKAFKNIDLINADVCDMAQIPDNSVDFVHSMYLFNLIPEAKCEQAFKEINRICKDGAIVFIILSLAGSAPKKPQGETLQPKYFWDEIASKFGMKDGAKAYYQKLMLYNEAGWAFMRQYQWPYLLYKVVKNVEKVDESR